MSGIDLTIIVSFMESLLYGAPNAKSMGISMRPDSNATQIPAYRQPTVGAR